MPRFEKAWHGDIANNKISDGAYRTLHAIMKRCGSRKKARIPRGILAEDRSKEASTIDLHIAELKEQNIIAVEKIDGKPSQFTLREYSDTPSEKTQRHPTDKYRTPSEYIQTPLPINTEGNNSTRIETPKQDTYIDEENKTDYEVLQEARARTSPEERTEILKVAEKRVFDITEKYGDRTKTRIRSKSPDSQELDEYKKRGIVSEADYNADDRQSATA